jgi:hypothetical protein
VTSRVRACAREGAKNASRFDRGPANGRNRDVT